MVRLYITYTQCKNFNNFINLIIVIILIVVIFSTTSDPFIFFAPSKIIAKD